MSSDGHICCGGEPGIAAEPIKPGQLVSRSGLIQPARGRKTHVIGIALEGADAHGKINPIVKGMARVNVSYLS